MGNGGLWICISLVKLDFWIFLDVWDIFLGKGGKGFGHLIKYGEWGIVDIWISLNIFFDIFDIFCWIFWIFSWEKEAEGLVI